MRKFPNSLPQPAESLRGEFGAEVADRSAEVFQGLVDRQWKLASTMHVDLSAELDRLDAMGVLPKDDTFVRRLVNRARGGPGND